MKFKPFVPFFVWLILFYSVWLVIASQGDHFEQIRNHWQIAVAMLFGSYVAGSTPMGGGTIGFPILVMLLDQVPRLGRDFSFCIQSIGMTSASIYIVCSRGAVDWRTLSWACLGALVGTPLGIVFVAPWFSDLWIKLTFAVVWAGFGLFTLLNLKQVSSHHYTLQKSKSLDRFAGLLIGLLGGATVAAVTGVGVDMLIYSYLVMVKRADLKTAIPTSVILMAFTSLVGVGTLTVIGHDLRPVFPFWLAAAPVVALGAPLGALVVAFIGRRKTLVVVSLLCLLQMLWTCWRESSDYRFSHWAFVVGGIAIATVGCHYLLEWGNGLVRAERDHPTAET